MENYMENYGELWSYMENYGATQRTRENYGELYEELTIWRYMENYGELWRLWRTMEHYGAIWRAMENYGELHPQIKYEGEEELSFISLHRCRTLSSNRLSVMVQVSSSKRGRGGFRSCKKRVGAQKSGTGQGFEPAQSKEKTTPPSLLPPNVSPPLRRAAFHAPD